MFIDTHAHLYLEDFDFEKELVLENAIQNGVEKILLPAIDSESFKALMQTVADYPTICYPMIGLHPTSVNDNYKEELQFVENQLKTNKFIAIGEIGLDLYWDKTHQIKQVEAFDIQIQWALEYDLPIIIHSRSAVEETFKVLDNYSNRGLKGIFHCFPSGVEHARKAIEMGFLIGVGGVVTFKNSGLDKVVKELDLSAIVLETDAPFLTPVPHRGKRNEPAYLTLIAQKIAEIHGVSIEKVAEITTQNVMKMFRF